MKEQIGLLFDMDGVIADTNPFHHKSLTQFLSKYDKTVSDDYLKEFVWGRANMEWIPSIFGDISETELEKKTIEKEQLFIEMYRPHLMPVKGLLSFLNAMEEERFIAAVATSAPKMNADFILGELAIERHFKSIVTAADITKSKPNPEIYHIAARNIGLSESQCIVLEDSLSGVASGIAAGCKVIGITTTHNKEELSICDLLIDDFDQLSLNQLSALVNK